MTRALFTISDDSDRRNASDRCLVAAIGTRVEFKLPRRSPEQSNLMWARLNDIADQAVWHGQKLEPTDWKDMFTAGLRRARIVPNIDGDGFVQLGLHTSDLTKEEMSNLLDLMDAFAAQRGITFKEQPNSADGALPAGSSDTPAAESGPQTVAAGVTSSNWFEYFVKAMSEPLDVPLSLKARRERAMSAGLAQFVVGNENRIAILDRVQGLVRDRNQGAIQPAEFELSISKLKAVAEGTRHAA